MENKQLIAHNSESFLSFPARIILLSLESHTLIIGDLLAPLKLNGKAIQLMRPMPLEYLPWADLI